jgi:hypothetical protein
MNAMCIDEVRVCVLLLGLGLCSAGCYDRTSEMEHLTACAEACQKAGGALSRYVDSTGECVCGPSIATKDGAP